MLTWVLSSLTVVGLALSALTVVARSDEFFADFQRQEPALVEDYGVTEANVVAALLVVFGGLILWALAAIVLAGLAFAGHNWARVTLAVSAAVAGVTALVFALNAPPLVVLTLLFAVSTWLLLRPDVAQWYQQRRSMR